jgi:UDP-glucose 4-epimerase
MRCLVTGGAGFIGSHIQDELIKLGYQVTVVDNLSSGKKAYLNPKAKFYKLDIRSASEILDLFKKLKPEVVFHLAAQIEVPYSMAHPLEDTQINILGTLNILEACKLTGVKKIIYSNTGGAYYGDVPQKNLPVTEDYPVSLPTSFYGVSKAASEQYVKLYSHVYGMSYVALRYANVYGPRQDGNREAGIVAIFTTKMLAGETPVINGDGLHTRDYIYVGDVVAANIAALNYKNNDYFNISTGIPTSNNEVFATLEGYLKTGKPVEHGPDRPGDARHVILSAQKAKSRLKWSNEVNFKEGVRLTLEAYGWKSE